MTITTTIIFLDRKTEYIKQMPMKKGSHPTHMRYRRGIKKLQLDINNIKGVLTLV